MTEKIINWIREYAEKSRIKSLVVGVSGGVDSALVSTLCSMTGLPTFLVSMPIRQAKDQLQRARDHMKVLSNKYPNVTEIEIDLSKAFLAFEREISSHSLSLDSPLGLANSRSRYRMMTLYQIAASFNGIVVGTGNKIEDFGVGFFTKYGDGGVDISPIADLYKSEVRKMAKELGVSDDITNAAPTDGLWDDGRIDEDQIGASYNELEWAMKYTKNNDLTEFTKNESLSDREKEVIKIYESFHIKNQHKMVSIPVFKLNTDERG